MQHPVWSLIAPWLPADARARFACVSKHMRDVMRDQTLAVHLDLNIWSGVTCAVNDATVLAAAAVAGGALESLDLHGRKLILIDVLATVAAANAATLRELYVGGGGIELTSAEVRRLLAEAPRMRILEADGGVACDVHTATVMLAGTPPFDPLRVHRIRVHNNPSHYGDLADAARAVAEALMRALMGLPAEAAPVDRSIKDLAIALRRNHDVGDVKFAVATPTGPKLANTAALLRALIGHASVWSLRVTGVGWEDMSGERGGPTAFGVYTALTSLVASDTLEDLSLPQSDNLNAALGTLITALPMTKRLRTLHASGANLSPVFVTEQLLPALRANTSLLELRLESMSGDELPPEAQQAMDLIAQRSQQA